MFKTKKKRNRDDNHSQQNALHIAANYSHNQWGASPRHKKFLKWVSDYQVTLW